VISDSKEEVAGLQQERPNDEAAVKNGNVFGITVFTCFWQLLMEIII
jgi:hypothetical protein